MDWNMVKWFGVLVGAGIVTALTVEFVTKRMQDYAVMAARAEIGNLVMAAQQQQAQQHAQVQIQQQPPLVNVPEPKDVNQFQGLIY